MKSLLLRYHRYEWLVVLGLSPLLVFPTLAQTATMGALVLLLLLWVGRWILTGMAWPLTPFNGVLLVLATSIVVGGLVSSHPDLTLRKISNLILGLALLRGMALAARNRRDIIIAITGFMLISAAFITVGALTTSWPAHKTPWLAPIVRHFPRLRTRLPELATSFVNPNQLAAVGLLSFPLAFALVREHPRMKQRGRYIQGLFVMIGTFGVFALLVTFFTQSRGGWMGIFGALVSLALFWRRDTCNRWVKALPIILLLFLFGVVMMAIMQTDLQEWKTVLAFQDSEGSIASLIGRSNMAWRWEVWYQAMKVVRYAPWTGIGLGAYRRVAQQLFPSDYLAKYHSVIYDSHQIFFQAAVDLGVPGLIAYLALVGSGIAIGFRMSKHHDPLVRSIAVGGTGSLVALHLYGLLNAMAPGSKPGLLFWYLLGLLAGIANMGYWGESDKRLSS